jgi:hypothetical protein
VFRLNTFPGVHMLTSYSHIRISFVFALASVTLFTTAAVAQNGAARTESPDKEVLSVQLTASGGISTKTPTLPSSGTVTATTKPAAEPTPEPLADGTKAVPKSTPNTGDLEAEVAAIKAENAEVREQLRRMAEGQKILIEQLDRLRRRLDAGTTANASSASRPIAPLSTADASAPPPGASPADASAPPPDASRTLQVGTLTRQVLQPDGSPPKLNKPRPSVIRTGSLSGRPLTTQRCRSC